MYRSIRTLGATLAVCLMAGTAAACGTATGRSEIALAPPAMPGQPAGTVVIPAGTDVATVVTTVKDAITSGGGTVAAEVDHGADAKAVGVDMAPTVVVMGGPADAQLALLRVDQRAALNLPQRYLVRRGTDGAVTVTANGADYITAVSGITVAGAGTRLDDAATAVAELVVRGGPIPLTSSLVGVSPANYVLSVFGSADVPVTVERLRRSAIKVQSTLVTALDMAAGSAAPGPAIRPTTVALVSMPTAEAPLLAAAPSFGLEMPMRFVVWIDDQLRTQIGYPDVRRLAARHGIPVDDPNVVKMVADADRLAKLAAGIVQ